MKRFFLWLTLACFIITSVGVVVTQSCCRLTGEVMKSCCANDDGSCCKKEVHVIKIQDDYLSTSYPSQTISSFSFLLSYNQNLISDQNIAEPFIKHDSGPPIAIQFTNTFTQSFRI